MAAAESPEPNYYQILGVGSRVDPGSLKKAFHHLTKLYHPDRNPAHLERFKEISRAYRVLSDPLKRQEYDMKLLRSIQQRQMRDFLMRTSASHLPTVLGGDGGFRQGASNQPPPKQTFNYRQQLSPEFLSPRQRQQFPRPRHAAPPSQFNDVHHRQQQQQPQYRAAAAPPPPPQQQRQQPRRAQQQQQYYQQHHVGGFATPDLNHSSSSLPTWDSSRVQVVRCAVCHGTGTSVRYERLGRGLMRELKVLCSACSGRGTWCKLYSINA